MEINGAAAKMMCIYKQGLQRGLCWTPCGLPGSWGLAPTFALCCPVSGMLPLSQVRSHPGRSGTGLERGALQSGLRV